MIFHVKKKLWLTVCVRWSSLPLRTRTVRRQLRFYLYNVAILAYQGSSSGGSSNIISYLSSDRAEKVNMTVTATEHVSDDAWYSPYVSVTTPSPSVRYTRVKVRQKSNRRGSVDDDEKRRRLMHYFVSVIKERKAFHSTDVAILAHHGSSSGGSSNIMSYLSSDPRKKKKNVLFSNSPLDPHGLPSRDILTMTPKEP